MANPNQKLVSTIIIGTIFIVLLFFLLNIKAHADPLQFEIMTDKNIFAPDEIIEVTVKLKNTGGTPVVVPKINPDDGNVQQAYIQLEIFHESGVQIFFLPSPGEEEPFATPADDTQVLPSGEELIFIKKLNESKIGALGYTDPNNPDSLESFSGTFTIAAQFVVNDENLPTVGNAAVFRGTIPATEPVSITVTAPLSSNCPDDVLISNYQTTPSGNQFVEVANVGNSTINIGACSLVTFNVQTERSIGDATVGLSNTLAPGETKRITFTEALPAGPAAVGIYDVMPPPPDGSPFTTDNEITGMVYLDNNTVFGISHLTKPEHNTIYECIYGGSGQGPFTRPFQSLADCFVP